MAQKNRALRWKNKETAAFICSLFHFLQLQAPTEVQLKGFDCSHCHAMIVVDEDADPKQVPDDLSE